jgi:UDPglucose 6-dehydrogenase
MATGKVVAVLGVAFKAETDDIRESPAISIVRELLGAGARVRVHDPKALTAFRAMFGDSVSYFDDQFACLADADAAIILTEWNEYRNLDLERTKKLMQGNIILDARNVLEPERAKSLGFIYSGVGR